MVRVFCSLVDFLSHGDDVAVVLELNFSFWIIRGIRLIAAASGAALLAKMCWNDFFEESTESFCAALPLDQRKQDKVEDYQGDGNSKILSDSAFVCCQDVFDIDKTSFLTSCSSDFVLFTGFVDVSVVVNKEDYSSKAVLRSDGKKSVN